MGTYNICHLFYIFGGNFLGSEAENYVVHIIESKLDNDFVRAGLEDAGHQWDQVLTLHKKYKVLSISYSTGTAILKQIYTVL